MVDLGTWRQFARDMAELPLLYNAPLSERRATQLIERLQISERARILDLGCGWGELLLHTLSKTPGAVAVGVDRDVVAINRARAAATERDLRERVTFVCGDLVAFAGPPADVLFAVGISYATSNPRHTLTLIRESLTPGGSALYADGYWKRRPTRAERAAIGSDSRELGSLGDLSVDAVAVGFEVLSVSEADDDELQSYARMAREGLMQRSSARVSDYERMVIERHERLWRDVLQYLEGFAYLELRKV